MCISNENNFMLRAIDVHGVGGSGLPKCLRLLNKRLGGGVVSGLHGLPITVNKVDKENRRSSSTYEFFPEAKLNLNPGDELIMTHLGQAIRIIGTKATENRFLP